MFVRIRRRLLLSNLLVFAVVLSGFAIAVRVVFVHNARQQAIDRLTALGRGIAASTEWEGGSLKFDSDFSVTELNDRHQALQWFDERGHFLQQQGTDVISFPFRPEERLQLQTQEKPIQAVVLPLIDSDSGRLRGYLRVSQSLEEVRETIRQLDWGLGMGALVALALSGMGGLWLNRQAMRPIEDSFDRLKQFTADASHELRNPLMAIKSNAAVALKYPNAMREGDREKLTAILDATRQMTNLTEDLLLLARTDNLPIRGREEIDLTKLLKKLFLFYQPQAESKKLTLKADLEEDLIVWGDREKLSRLFGNLLGNALTYNSPGGSVEITANNLAHQAIVEVRDTGIGIAPDSLEKVFDRFWQGDRSRSSHGTGLGLAIARTIVQQHGGKITVKSELGQGTCFRVTFSKHE
jgi:signal transduction histidine kinase